MSLDLAWGRKLLRIRALKLKESTSKGKDWESLSELSLQGGGERGLLAACYTDTQRTLHNNLYCQKKLLCLLQPPSWQDQRKGALEPRT